MKPLTDILMRSLYRLAYKAITGLWFFTRPSISGVFIAVWHQGSILIVKNSYRKWFILPCGGVKTNEPVAGAAVRELYEEAGIETDIYRMRYWGKIAQRYKYALDNGFFFELELAEAPPIRIDNREIVWAGFMRPAAALALRLNPLVREYLSACRRR